MLASLIRKHSLLFTIILLASVILSACGQAAAIKSPTKTSAVAIQNTSFSGAGCKHAIYDVGRNYEIIQEMNGSISACLRVGALASGKYSVELYDIPLLKGQTAPNKGVATPPSTRSQPPVKMTLAPESGKPGNLVQVTGILGSPLARQLHHANLCWDSCSGGLSYQGVTLKWLSPTKFQTHLTIPAAPWLAGNPAKVTPLTSDNYSIGIQCLDTAKGCGLGGSQGSAKFHLTVGSSQTPWCRSDQNCAILSASPNSAYPGDVIKITGFAPLLSVLGSNSPQLFELKVIKGAPKGPEIIQKPLAKVGSNSIYMGHALLNILPPQSFSSLGTFQPKVLANSGISQIAQDPSNPAGVDWCSAGLIQLAGPNGPQTISTASVNSDLQQLGYTLFAHNSPNCTSLAVVGTGSIPQLIAASFEAQPKMQSPQFANVALMTKDGGKSWVPIPVPAGASMNGFGGFRQNGNSLEALFSPSFSGSSYPSASPVPLVEATSNSGTSWKQQSLACPSSGPCVTFGPYLAGNCAGGVGVHQSVLYSSDDGKTWSTPIWPKSIQACSPAQLIELPSNKVLLVTTSSQFVARTSSNGGKTWKDLAVPLPKSSQSGYGIGPGQGGFQILPDGSLLLSAQISNGYNWQLLSPGTDKWCSFNNVSSQFIVSSVYQIGNKLWWLSAKPTGHTFSPQSTINSISLRNIHC